MPKFQATAEIVLRSYIYPDGVFDLDTSLIEDMEDQSSFGDSESVRFYGGQIQFTVEGATDTEARARAEDAVGNYLYFSDSSGIEWEFEDWTITEFTPLEEPLTIERATTIVRDWMAGPTGLNIPLEVREALVFLLDAMSAMLAREMVANAPHA